MPDFGARKENKASSAPAELGSEDTGENRDEGCTLWGMGITSGPRKGGNGHEGGWSGSHALA